MPVTLVGCFEVQDGKEIEKETENTTETATICAGLCWPLFTIKLGIFLRIWPF